MPSREKVGGRLFGKRLWSTDFRSIPRRVEYDIPEYLYQALPNAARELHKLAMSRFHELLDEGDEGEIAWDLMRHEASNLMLLYRAHRTRKLLWWIFGCGIAAGALAIVTILWNALFTWCPWSSL